jgi:hypothetical protein
MKSESLQELNFHSSSAKLPKVNMILLAKPTCMNLYTENTLPVMVTSFWRWLF